MADGTSALDFATANASERMIGAKQPHYPASAPLGVPAFLVPNSLGEVKELARMIALAEWAPECYRDVDGNYLQPKIELAILHGATVGLGPIAAVHAIALIGGTPSIWGDGALSVIEHSGLLEDMVEDYEDDGEEGLTAICTMKRRDRATRIVTRFSMAMAERAGLTRSEGPWQTYPERMLRMRARSWTMRDAFADVLRGLQLREEVEDYAGRGGTRPRRSPQGEAGPRQYASPRPRHSAGSNGAGRSADRPIAVSELTGGCSEDRPAAKTLPAEEPFTLVDADEHLKSAQGVTNPARDDHPGPGDPSSNATARPNGSEQDNSSEPERSLALEIDPTWGIQKIFQHYRAAFTAIYDSSNRNQPTIAGFRRVNIAVEQRLRSKLPSRMGPIDAIYQRAGLEP